MTLTVDRFTDTYSLFALEGEYSIVLTRSIVDGNVTTAVVASSVAQPVPEGATPFAQLLRLAAVADLNGDGTMELVVQSNYYEGSGAELYEAEQGGRFTQVLSVGCGV